MSSNNLPTHDVMRISKDEFESKMAYIFDICILDSMTPASNGKFTFQFKLPEDISSKMKEEYEQWVKKNEADNDTDPDFNRDMFFYRHGGMEKNPMVKVYVDSTVGNQEILYKQYTHIVNNRKILGMDEARKLIQDLPPSHYSWSSLLSKSHNDFVSSVFNRTQQNPNRFGSIYRIPKNSIYPLNNLRRHRVAYRGGRGQPNAFNQKVEYIYISIPETDRKAFLKSITDVTNYGVSNKDPEGRALWYDILVHPDTKRFINNGSLVVSRGDIFTVTFNTITAGDDVFDPYEILVQVNYRGRTYTIDSDERFYNWVYANFSSKDFTLGTESVPQIDPEKFK